MEAIVDGWLADPSLAQRYKARYLGWMAHPLLPMMFHPRDPLVEVTPSELIDDLRADKSTMYLTVTLLALLLYDYCACRVRYISQLDLLYL